MDFELRCYRRAVVFLPVFFPGATVRSALPTRLAARPTPCRFLLFDSATWTSLQPPKVLLRADPWPSRIRLHVDRYGATLQSALRWLRRNPWLPPGAAWPPCVGSARRSTCPRRRRGPSRTPRGRPLWQGKQQQFAGQRKKKRHTCILRDFSACTPVFFAMREQSCAVRDFAIFRDFRDFFAIFRSRSRFARARYARARSRIAHREKSLH